MIIFFFINQFVICVPFKTLFCYGNKKYCNLAPKNTNSLNFDTNIPRILGRIYAACVVTATGATGKINIDCPHCSFAT